MFKNLLSSLGTGKNAIALNSIMNTTNAEFDGWPEFALVVLMVPKRDVSVQVQVREVSYRKPFGGPADLVNDLDPSQSLFWPTGIGSRNR